MPIPALAFSGEQPAGQTAPRNAIHYTAERAAGRHTLWLTRYVREPLWARSRSKLLYSGAACHSRLLAAGTLGK